MTDGTHLKSDEEAWIAKYRTALENVPVEESRLEKILKVLGKLHKALNLRFDRALGRMKPELQKSNPRVGPALVAQPAPTQPLPAMHGSSQRPASAGKPAKKGSKTTRTLQTTTKRQVQ
jgi:hypothetical protein